MLRRIVDATDDLEALLEAGELAQGLLDHTFAARGALDAEDDLSRATLALVRTHANPTHRPAARESARSLLTSPLPDSIKIRTPEGFAFYALDPTLHAEAARSLHAPATVVGIRSIGTTLGAVVAEAIGARFTTVRPTGHPFARHLSLSPELTRAWREADGLFVVVDEGPGLSGSSFGAVGDALEDLGVDPARMVFLPSHDGPLGPRASERHRARWSRVRRIVEPFARIERTIPELFEPLLGRAISPLEDLAAGAWRRRRYAREADWPACDPWRERRKYLLETERGRFLLKFAGLGRAGRRAFERAQRLAERGLAPEVAGFRRGWLATRWIDRARPLEAVDPRILFDRVIELLVFAAGERAEPEDGADTRTLFEMMHHNTEVALGHEIAPALDLAAVEARRKPVRVVARMFRHEWLVTPDGAILHADAVDHHAAHDLVGAQPIAWDVAGAIVELGLDRAALLEALDRRGVEVHDLDFHHRAYLAFQLGAHALAAESAPEDEAARLRAAAGRYGSALRSALA